MYFFNTQEKSGRAKYNLAFQAMCLFQYLF